MLTQNVTMFIILLGFIIVQGIYTKMCVPYNNL